MQGNLDTSFLYDGSISPSTIGMEPSFEYNFFNDHFTKMKFPALILCLFFST